MNRMSLLGRGALCTALIAAIWTGSRIASAQEGHTTSSQRGAPRFTRELALDTQVGADLHVNFLVSGPLVDGRSKLGCRIASIMAFTTVRGAIQFDIAHLSPSLDPSSAKPVEFLIGYDHEGAAGDFAVRLTPLPGKTWGDLEDVDDLAISTTRQ